MSSWNIHEGVIPDDPVRPATEMLAAAVVRQRSDVLALQEVPFESSGGSALLDAVATLTGLVHVLSFPLSPAMYGKDARAGIALLSHRPWLAGTEALLPNPGHLTASSGGALHSWDKGVLAGRLSWPGGRQVWVGCGHLYPFTRLGAAADDPEVRPVWQGLADFLLKLDAGPLVLCADFNSDRRELLTDLMAERPLRRSITRPTSHRELAVDDILYDPALTLKHSSVWRGVSDHALCTVELEWEMTA